MIIFLLNSFHLKWHPAEGFSLILFMVLHELGEFGSDDSTLVFIHVLPLLLKVSSVLKVICLLNNLLQISGHQLVLSIIPHLLLQLRIGTLNLLYVVSLDLYSMIMFYKIAIY